MQILWSIYCRKQGKFLKVDNIIIKDTKNPLTSAQMCKASKISYHGIHHRSDKFEIHHEYFDIMVCSEKKYIYNWLKGFF